MLHLHDIVYLLALVKLALQAGVPRLYRPTVRSLGGIPLALLSRLVQAHCSKKRLQMEAEKMDADRVSGRPLPWAPVRSSGTRRLAGLLQLHLQLNGNARAWVSVINGCMKRAEDYRPVVVSFRFHSPGCWAWASLANECDVCNFGLEPHIVKICHGVRYNRDSILFIHHVHCSFATNLSPWRGLKTSHGPVVSRVGKSPSSRSAK